MMQCAAVIAFTGEPVPHAAAQSAGGSQVEKLKAACEQARKKGNGAAEADALYNLARAYFDAKDLPQSEQVMRQSLQVESTLQRPQSAVQTRVALANILVALHRSDEALKIYKEALELAVKNNLSDQAASIANNMGTLSLVSGRYEDAEQLFKQARDKAHQDANASTEGNALVNLAVIARARNQPEAAMKFLNEAADVLKDAGDDRALAAVYMELGRTRSDLGKQDEAIDSYKKALQLQKGQLDEISAARSLLAMGQIYLIQEKFSDARSVLQQAEQSLHGDQNLPAYIDVLIAAGGAEAGLGNFQEAQKIHLSALELAGKAKDPKRERTILSELGYDNFASGLPEQAMEKYLKAFNLLSDQEPNNWRQKGILQTDIAMSCKALGQLSAAISNYLQAVDNFNKAGDTAGKAMALDSLAVAYLDNGKLAEFTANYEKAKELFASMNDQRGQATLDYNLAQYRLAEGHPADAVPLYDGALEKIGSSGDIKLQGQILRGLGLAYLYLGRSGKALECFQKAKPLAESSNNIEAQWECALGLGKAYKALGQMPEAVNNLRSAVGLVEKERSRLSRDTFKTYNLDLRQDCYTSLVDALVSSHEAAEALEIAEAGRARAFLDLLQGRGSRNVADAVSGASLPGESGLSLSALRPAETGTRGIEVVPRATTFVEASAISPINAQPPPLSEIKSLVNGSGSTFVEYFVLRDKVLAWVVHPDGQIEMAPPIVISKKALTERIAETYRAVIARPKTPGELKQVNETRQRKLAELYSTIFEPVVPLLPTAPDAVVTIVPHGPLFSVPFAALTDKDGRFLVETHTINYIPAIGVLRAARKLNEEGKAGGYKLLGFGNPITKEISFLGTLPYSAKEVRRVAELFGADHSVVKIGADATKAAFVQLSPHSNVIHLATHGLVNEERPMDSALVLAPSGDDDGLLTVKDILQLPQLKARLIVLSACQTARGKITGDGVVGLSRSFIIAGTPSILVSQWNVDDVITEYQMVAFYKSFLAGDSKARALREAQLKTIALLEKTDSSDGKSSGVQDRGKAAPESAVPLPPSARANPRYWAAFQLIGEYK